MRSIFNLSTAGTILTLASAVPAAADFKVRMPDANPGEIAVEPLGDYGHDPNPAHSGELSLTQEFEYGVNGFWRTNWSSSRTGTRGPDSHSISLTLLPKTSFSSPSVANTGWMPAFLPNSASRRSKVTPTNSPWDRFSARKSSARSIP
jgi:hypothetical protein